MELISPTKFHLEEIMGWFSDRGSLFMWAGPNFRFPCTLKSFEQDLRIDKLASFSLMDDNNELVAFGQYYLRLHKCHLCRLVVSPFHRGKGVAQKLMQLLIEEGEIKLGVSSSSLFVLKNNFKAIKSYELFGFKNVEYPESMPIANCIYMIK